MIVHLTKRDWEKFLSENKIAVLRIKEKELGHYKVLTGNLKLTQKHVGWLDLVKKQELHVTDLTHRDAIELGHDDLQGLMSEVKITCGNLPADAVVWKYYVDNVKRVN